MKLSEAIRLGAMLKPQGHCMLFYEGKTCAIGAALDAAGALMEVASDESGNIDNRPHQITAARFPIVTLSVEAPHTPNMYHASDSLHSVITGLNDCAKWTREQIADWVEGIEQVQEANERRAIAEGQPVEPAKATSAA